MKNIKLFGKTIPIWVLALMLATPAFAALVNYLSNTIVMQATFSSPFEIKWVNASEGTIAGDTLTINTYGGEELDLITSDTNHANKELSRYPVIILTDNSGSAIQGKEFAYVYARWDHDNDGTWDDPEQNSSSCTGEGKVWIEGKGCFYDITNLLFAVNPTDGSLIPFKNADKLNSPTIQIFFDNNGDGQTQPYKLGPGVTQIQELIVGVAPNVNGSYTVKLVDAFSLPA